MKPALDSTGERMAADKQVLKQRFADLQTLAKRLGARVDDVRAEQDPLVQRLIAEWRIIAPGSHAAVIEFLFDALEDDVGPLLKRVGGFPDQRRVITRPTVSR